MNQGCSVINQRVWVHKGYGKFDINYEIENSNCPMCRQQLEASAVRTVGYRSARVKCEGKRFGGQAKIEWEDT